MKSFFTPERSGSRRLLLVVSVAIAGCTTLSPQLFSGHLVTPAPPAADGARVPLSAVTESRTVSLQVALNEAGQVQRQYIDGVVSLSELNSGTSAALIGLSALGLYKAVTNPNPKDLAGIGIAGGATYAYGTTMTSRQRGVLYTAGAKAVGCAMFAARAYGEATEAGVKLDTVRSRIDEAQVSVLEIDKQLDVLGALNETRHQTQLVGSPAQAFCTQVPVRCHSKACEAAAKQLREGCTGPAKVDVSYAPHPDVAITIKHLKQLSRELAATATIANGQLLAFASSGNELQYRTDAIQFAVSVEVGKTEADPTTVLAAASAIRGTAFGITGAPAFGPVAPASAPGNAASSPSNLVGGVTKGQSSLSGGNSNRIKIAPRPDQELKEADDVAAHAAAKLASLRNDAQTMKAAIRTAAQRARACKEDPVLGGLTVTPDTGELDMAPGAAQAFSVSGGVGTPTGSVVGGADTKVGELSRRLDGSFEYKVAPNAANGQSQTLRFVDGAGKASHEVIIRVAVPIPEQASVILPTAAALTLSHGPRPGQGIGGQGGPNA